MTVSDDAKKLAAKSPWWKWGLVGVGLLLIVGLFATGHKDEAYKVFQIAGEVIAVNSDGDVVAATAPVSVQNVSASTIASATVPVK